MFLQPDAPEAHKWVGIHWSYPNPVSIESQTCWNDSTHQHFPTHPPVCSHTLSRNQNPVFVITWKTNFTGGFNIGTTEFKKWSGNEGSDPAFHQTDDNTRKRGVFCVRVPDVATPECAHLHLSLGFSNTDTTFRGFSVPCPSKHTFVRSLDVCGFPIRRLETLHQVGCLAPEGGWPFDQLPVSADKINFKQCKESTQDSHYGVDRAGPNPANDEIGTYIVSFSMMGHGWVETLDRCDGGQNTIKECNGCSEHMQLRLLCVTGPDPQFMFHANSSDSELSWGLFNWFQVKPTLEEPVEDSNGLIPHFGMHS